MLTVGTLVALGKTKVNYEYAILRLLAAADEEVVGFDVSVDDALLVHFLDALDQLNGYQQHCFEIELPFAGLE